MKSNLFLFFLVFFLSNLTFADTVYVASKTDAKLLAYQDTLYAYETGKSICESLAVIFQKLTNSHDYDSYFLDAWSGNIKFNQPVDTLLTFSVFLPNDNFPEDSLKYQFNSNSDIGQKITLQFIRLDTIKIIPYARVEGSEMPVVYIYRKPTRVVLYKKLDKCWLPKHIYRTIDTQTHFILNNKDRTITPYNIINYYEGNILKKIEWVDPLDNNKIIKNFLTKIN